MRKHLPALSLWSLAYVALVAFGARRGIRPEVVFPALLLLSLPPLFFCMRASRRVMKRTRHAFPDQWAALNRDWMKLDLRSFLFDERTFGDETIAVWKRELRWWARAGMLALVLFVPTLLLVERLSR